MVLVGNKTTSATSQVDESGQRVEAAKFGCTLLETPAWDSRQHFKTFECLIDLQNPQGQEGGEMHNSV